MNANPMRPGTPSLLLTLATLQRIDRDTAGEAEALVQSGISAREMFAWLSERGVQIERWPCGASATGCANPSNNRRRPRA